MKKTPPLAFRPWDEALALPGAGRPDPPPELDQMEREEWKKAVDAMPPGWFGRASHAILAMYCAHVARTRWINQELRAQTSVTRLSTPEMIALAELARREADAAAKLAKALRMTTPQFPYKDRRVTRALERVAKGPRPWDDERDDVG
jgi:hypothetical protein